MDNFTISLIVAVTVGVCVAVLGKMWEANQNKDD